MNLYAKRNLKLLTRDIIHNDGISQIFFYIRKCICQRKCYENNKLEIIIKNTTLKNQQGRKKKD